VTDAVPPWVTVLTCAEKWGVPPWVVGDLRGERKRWLYRQRLWNEAQAKRQCVEAERWERR
jgi:hypothetical protein